MFCSTAAASYWDNPVRVCLLSGVWWSWWTILKSERRSMLNWTPFLERRTWLQSQTLATTNCHISLLLSSKLWGFIWRFHSLSPTWTSMTPRLLDMTFHLRANPGECMVDCKHTQNTGTNLKSSSQIVSWMQTLRWEAMISVFFHFGAGRWSWPGIIITIPLLSIVFGHLVQSFELLPPPGLKQVDATDILQHTQLWWPGQFSMTTMLIPPLKLLPPTSSLNYTLGESYLI